MDADERRIPDKLFFTIGEVARLTGLKTHVIRYWETEFPTLRPQKKPDGRRIYRRGDVELVIKIRDLLYREKFTIAGARRRLAGRTRADAAETSAPEVLREIRQELTALVGEIDRELRDDVL